MILPTDYRTGRCDDACVFECTNIEGSYTNSFPGESHPMDEVCGQYKYNDHTTADYMQCMNSYMSSCLKGCGCSYAETEYICNPMNPSTMTKGCIFVFMK